MIRQRNPLRLLLQPLWFIFMVLISVAAPAPASDFGLSPSIYHGILDAQRLATKKPDAAIALLQNLEQKGTLKPYERAFISHEIGYLLFSKNQYAHAIEAYLKTLQYQDSEHGIPPSLRDKTHHALAQLYTARGRFNKASGHLKHWLNTANTIKANDYALMGYVQYQLERFSSAAGYYEKALRYKLTATQREQWLQMLSACYARSGNVKKRIIALKKLLKANVSPRYFIALANAYGANNQSALQAATLEAAYQNNMLTSETEWITLASLLLMQKAPIKAAQLLEDGLKKGRITYQPKHLTLLANSYIEAREYQHAIKVLTEHLQRYPEHKDNPSLRYTLGQLHTDLQQWQNAIDVLKPLTFTSEHLKRAGKAALLIGRNHLQLKQFTAACNTFKNTQANRHVSSDASQWLQFCELEKQRHTALARTP